MSQEIEITDPNVVFDRVWNKETVGAQYFADLTGINITRSGQLLNKKGYRLDKMGMRKAMYPKDKVDALAAIYVEGMRPLSEVECTREDLRRLLGNISKIELYLLMKHDQFPVPSRMFMKVAGGAPPIKVWLIADILAVDVQKLLSEVKTKPKEENQKERQSNIKDCFTYEGLKLEIIKFLRGDYTAYSSQIEA